MSKKNIAVIFGGVSVEHDVSILTAQQTMNAIDTTKFNIIPVYISLQGEWFCDDVLRNKEFFKDKSKIKELPEVWITPFRNDSNLYSDKKGFGGLLKGKTKIPFDIAFPLVHGSNGEDGTLQGIFDLKNIPYVGSNTLSSSLCMNKYLTKQIMNQISIHVLPCTYVEMDEWYHNEKEVVELFEKEYSYPVIVKPNSLGSSIGVKGVNNREELGVAVDNAFKIDTALLIEPMIIDMMEINCAVLDGKEKIISRTEQPLSGGKLLDFSTKYMKGGKVKKLGTQNRSSTSSRGMEDTPRIIPAPCDPGIIKKVEGYSLNAFEAMGCSGVVRIDYIFDVKEDRLYLNELNTIPGSLAYYLFKDLDIDFTDLTTLLLENAVRVYGLKNRKTFNYNSGLF